jgi:hypothetical protein
MTATSLPTGKFLIKPDLKKGKVCLSRGDDQLLHFQWTDRTTGATPDVSFVFVFSFIEYKQFYSLHIWIIGFHYFSR